MHRILGRQCSLHSYSASVVVVYMQLHAVERIKAGDSDGLWTGLVIEIKAGNGRRQAPGNLTSVNNVGNFVFRIAAA